MTDADIVRAALETDDASFGHPDAITEEALAALDRLLAEYERLRDWHGKTVPIVAALAIYGDRAILSSLAEKARALNEAKP